MLCDGRYINSGSVADINKAELIKMIIGRELTNAYPPLNTKLGETILEVKDLSSKKAFKNIGYSVEQQVMNAADYGIPQRRKRVIIVGLKNKKFI